MAKQKAQAGLVELPAGPPEVPAAAPEPGKFRVTLNCPTPLAYQTLTVEAADEVAAWQKFCAANGITDSRHDRKVERVS